MEISLIKGDKIIKEILPNGQVIDHEKYLEKIEEFNRVLTSEGYKLINKNKISCNLNKLILLFEDKDKSILNKLNNRLFLLEIYNEITLVRIAHSDILQLNGLYIDKVLDLILDLLLGKIDNTKNIKFNNLIIGLYDEDISDLELMLGSYSYKSSKLIQNLKGVKY